MKNQFALWKSVTIISVPFVLRIRTFSLIPVSQNMKIFEISSLKYSHKIDKFELFMGKLYDERDMIKRFKVCIFYYHNKSTTLLNHRISLYIWQYLFVINNKFDSTFQFNFSMLFLDMARYELLIVLMIMKTIINNIAAIVRR